MSKGEGIQIPRTDRTSVSRITDRMISSDYPPDFFPRRHIEYGSGQYETEEESSWNHWIPIEKPKVEEQGDPRINALLDALDP